MRVARSLQEPRFLRLARLYSSNGELSTAALGRRARILDCCQRCFEQRYCSALRSCTGSGHRPEPPRPKLPPEAIVRGILLTHATPCAIPADHGHRHSASMAQTTRSPAATSLTSRNQRSRSSKPILAWIQRRSWSGLHRPTM